MCHTTLFRQLSWSRRVQSPGETYLYHEDSGTLISDVLLWRGTPWPEQHNRAWRIGSQVEPEGLKVSMVGAVELSSQEKLRQHVLRGHSWPVWSTLFGMPTGTRSFSSTKAKFEDDFAASGVFRFAWCHCGERECQVTGQHLRQILAEFGCLKLWKERQWTDAQDEVGLFCGDLKSRKLLLFCAWNWWRSDWIWSTAWLPLPGMWLLCITSMARSRTQERNCSGTHLKELEFYCRDPSQCWQYWTVWWLLRICILSGTRLLILFVRKLLMNWSFSKPRVWNLFFRLSIHKISLNVLFVTQVQVIIHRLLIRHPLRFCQRILHDFQIRRSLHGIGLMLMDELKDAVHVSLDKVDIPRSAVSAIGIGSVTRRGEKCRLCPTSLRNNHQ